MKDNVLFQLIGEIRSCYPDKFGTPRQPGLVRSSWAKICIDRRWQPEHALSGLAEFSHVWVVFFFHKNEGDSKGAPRYHAKVHPPRMVGQKMGVFATRSPHRPNPIGLSLVKIESVEPDGVVVSGIDFVDGTPVLDLKPYLPEVESISGARAGWSEGLSESREAISIHWSKELLETLEGWESRSGHTHLRELIEETIRLDPRPNLYKGYEGQASPYRQCHAVRIFDGDVHFRFEDATHVVILECQVPFAGHGKSK